MVRSMTQGKPAKLIFMFTLPLLLGNLFQQLYNMMDTLIVGRALGENALAAVGCTSSIMFLIIGFVQGLTIGNSIVTSQCFGAQDMDGVRRSFAANIVIAAAVALALTGISVPMARTFLQLLRTPEAIIDDAYRYIVVIFGGVFAAMLFNLLSNVVRALGDSRTPLIFLAIASVVNIILDLVLILGLKLGVIGASIATVAAQIVSGVLCVGYVIRKFPVLHVTWQDFRLLRWHEIWRHARLGLPMGFQASIISIGCIAVQIMVNNAGETTVAAYTVAQKIESFIVQPLGSFGMAMATYTAQNYGAGKIDRIRQGVRQCAAMSLSYAIFSAVVMWTLGSMISGVFVTGAPFVQSQAHLYLRSTSLFYVTLSMLFIFRYSLQGLGQGLVPTIAGIMELVMRAGGVALLAKPFGFAGISVAYALAWPGSLLPLSIAYFITMRQILGRRGG